MTLLKTSKLRSLCNKVTSVFMTNTPCGAQKKKEGKSTKPESRQTAKKKNPEKDAWVTHSSALATSNPYQIPWGQKIVNIPAKR